MQIKLVSRDAGFQKILLVGYKSKSKAFQRLPPVNRRIYHGQFFNIRQIYRRSSRIVPRPLRCRSESLRYTLFHLICDRLTVPRCSNWYAASIRALLLFFITPNAAHNRQQHNPKHKGKTYTNTKIIKPNEQKSPRLHLWWHCLTWQ